MPLFERALGRLRPTPRPGFAPPPRAVADGLWVLDRRLGWVGGASLPTRTTLVRLKDCLCVLSLWVPDAPTRAALDALGPVTCLVAPNTFHHLFLGEAARAHPSASLHLPPGLRERRPEVPDGDVLGDAPAPAWSGVLDQIVFAPRPGVSEVVFLHRPSRTLLLTDLAFHVRSAATRIERRLWQLSGEWQRFGPSRTARWILLREREAVATLVERILAWDFERIVVAHGDVLEREARSSFEAAFAPYRRRPRA